MNGTTYEVWFLGCGGDWSDAGESFETQEQATEYARNEWSHLDTTIVEAHRKVVGLGFKKGGVKSEPD